jgi:ribonuclease III
VFLSGREYGSGSGRSKKEAEQRAAREAYARLMTEGPAEEAGEA